MFRFEQRNNRWTTTPTMVDALSQRQPQILSFPILRFFVNLACPIARMDFSGRTTPFRTPGIVIPTIRVVYIRT